MAFLYGVANYFNRHDLELKLIIVFNSLKRGDINTSQGHKELHDHEESHGDHMIMRNHMIMWDHMVMRDTMNMRNHLIMRGNMIM